MNGTQWKFAVIAASVIGIVSAALQAQGQDGSDDFTARYWQMVGGMAVGFLAHEAAHYAAGAGRVSFDDMRPVPNWSCGECSRDHIRFVSLAGFLEQIVSVEIIFGADAFPSRGPSFLHGFLAFNIALPLGYVYANEVSDAISGEGMGDLKAFNRAERRVIETALLAWSAVSMYRWYAAAERKTASLSYSFFAMPQYDGGIALFYATKF